MLEMEGVHAELEDDEQDFARKGIDGSARSCGSIMDLIDDLERILNSVDAPKLRVGPYVKKERAA